MIIIEKKVGWIVNWGKARRRHPMSSHLRRTQLLVTVAPSEATEGIVSRVLSPTSMQTSLEAGTGCSCWSSIWLWNPVLSQVQAPASQAREVIRIHLTRFRLKESCSLSMNKHSNKPNQFQKTTVEPCLSHMTAAAPLHSFLGLQWGKMAYVGSKLQLSHRYWTKLLRTARL